MMVSVFIWWACESNTQVVRWLISSFLGRPCFQGILGLLFFATISLEAAGVANEEVVFIDELDEVVGRASWEGATDNEVFFRGAITYFSRFSWILSGSEMDFDPYFSGGSFVKLTVNI